MPDSPELASLLAQYKQMDVAAEPQRAKEVLARAAPLVDRVAAPKKWAAVRMLFADLALRDDPTAAIAAYRDALTVWRPDEDRDSRAHCDCELGCYLANNFPPGSAEGEEGIVHLEQAVGNEPYLAELLAALYGFRPVGDPHENWLNRIKYLELAIKPVDKATDLNKWARLSNELACAYTEEPGLDDAAFREKRIALLTPVFAALRETDPPFVETCLNLATSYLDRLEGDPAQNGARAEEYLRHALDACAGKGDGSQEARTLLLLGRCRVFFWEAERQRENLHEALKLFEQARRLEACERHPELGGSLEKVTAVVYLELLRQGEHQHLEPFLACCEAALRLFDGPTYIDERRKVLQTLADGLFVVEDFAKARKCCEQALLVAETLLAQATTTAGRIARIWELRDSTGLLAYCCAKTGDLAAAVDALDRGKALLWDSGERVNASELISDLIPANGALLLPLFSAPEGMVLIATRDAGAVKLSVVPLPHFGKARLSELQHGANPTVELGGWLQAYCFRHSRPADFREEIERIGGILHAEIWADLLAKLIELGVTDGAELVWFPQGGTNIFPVHAGWQMENGRKRWLLERYALRYAPSLKILARSARKARRPGSMSIISNPTGDLDYAVLEVEWIRQVNPDARVLAGAEATKEKVLEELRSCSRVHFAAHASFNMDDPLASHIKLAGGEHLTLREMELHLEEQRPEFIVLSACETAVARVTSVADEFLGFPAALLAQGVRTVLATQWPVDDAAAAFLIGAFYREYAGGGLSAAEALRRSQNWLREISVTELSSLLRDLRDRGGKAGEFAADIRKHWRDREGDEHPFAHPYYWAAFTLSGGS
jgi:tetratricopeptide (TPR) repeat protein